MIEELEESIALGFVLQTWEVEREKERQEERWASRENTYPISNIVEWVSYLNGAIGAYMYMGLGEGASPCVNKMWAKPPITARPIYWAHILSFYIIKPNKIMDHKIGLNKMLQHSASN